MGKSIRTTSNTQTPTNSTPATFKAGDAVLCPSIGNATYKLQPNGSDKNSTRLVIRIDDDSHGFYRDGRVLPNDSLPSLFHDTEANRQAVKTLHHGSTDTQSGMINLSAGKLSNIAEDIEQAVQALSDISQTLALIHYDKVPKFTGQSLARQAHLSADTWADILQSNLDDINDTLAMTTYGKGATHD